MERCKVCSQKRVVSFPQESKKSAVHHQCQPEAAGPPNGGFRLSRERPLPERTGAQSGSRRASASTPTVCDCQGQQSDASRRVSSDLRKTTEHDLAVSRSAAPTNLQWARVPPKSAGARDLLVLPPESSPCESGHFTVWVPFTVSLIGGQCRPVALRVRVRGLDTYY